MELLEFANEGEEAKGIMEKVKWLTARAGLGYNDIAVFYRTNAQSRSFERCSAGAASPTGSSARSGSTTARK